METILSISAGLIAVAFTALVIYLISTLKTLSNTLDRISGTLEKVETQVKEVTEEAEKLLHNTNALTMDLQEKSEKLNVVVDGVQELGKTVHGFNESLKEVSGNVVHQLRKNQEKVTQIIQWANIAVELKEKFEDIRLRKRRETKREQAER